MFDKIIKNIKNGLFENAYYEIKDLSKEEQKNIIYAVGYAFNISSYAFTNYLTLKKLDFFVTQKFSQILCFWMFNYFPGSTAAAYSHVLSMLEKAPTDLELLELQTYLYEIPGEVFSSSEMHQICKQVLALKPDSEQAYNRLIWTKKTALEVFPEVGHGLHGIEKTKVFIEKGRFSKAITNISTHSWNELIQGLRQFAVDGNLFAYAFIWELIRKNETVELHLLCAEFFSNQYLPFLNLNNFSGKEAIIFFHMYRAAELEPDNLEIQEQLLNLYEPGNESFDLQETKALVERVLTMNPESEQGLRVQKLLM